MPRFLIATLLALLFSSGAFAARDSRTSLVPLRGQKLTFEKTYSTDHLKNHPLQLVTKTSLTLSNSSGRLVGNWKATIRDIRTDEKIEAVASGICKAIRREKVECIFDGDAGNVTVVAKSDGALITIGIGQGVRFDKPSDEGLVWAEMLLGEDDENNTFRLNRSRRR